MVENSGTKIRSHQLRPLNQPRPITIAIEQGCPVAMIDKQGMHIAIESIEEEWTIDDEWWRDRVQRQYFRLRLVSGSIRTVFLDGESGRWFEQSY